MCPVREGEHTIGQLSITRRAGSAVAEPGRQELTEGEFGDCDNVWHTRRWTQ